MEWIALALAIGMGLVLGFMGAGGSMLTVPILVYLLGIKPELATGYSLLIVGVSSFLGAFAYWRNQSIHVLAAVHRHFHVQQNSTHAHRSQRSRPSHARQYGVMLCWCWLRWVLGC